MHGSNLSAADMQRVLDRYTTLSEAERRKVPGLNPERADIILAGIAVGRGGPLPLRRAGRHRLGLRPAGRAAAAPLAAHVGAQGTEPRASRCAASPIAAGPTAVTSSRSWPLAKTLFDAVGKRLAVCPPTGSCSKRRRCCTTSASWSRTRATHKHSYHLILHAESLPMTPHDRTLVAIISRYHRKSPPTKKHAEFAALEKIDRDRVRRLAALLRVAMVSTAATSRRSKRCMCGWGQRS